MTKQEAIRDFRETILPVIRKAYETDGRVDGPARREAWCNYVDYLHQDGHITDWQADNWNQPF